MRKQNFNLTGQAVMFASIAAAFPVVAHGAPAAKVAFAIGDATVVRPSGQTRPLTKGAQIDEGETINTNNGRAQLRFTDGAYVSLQPKSEFRIDQYRYEGKQDGSEKGFFSLLKGGLRTITGLVGRSNKQNYRVSTTVATIGIRGTEYTIQYGNSVTGTVGEGEIEVCNGAGCLNVTNGESYYVQNQDVKPVLSNKGTDLPPAPPENPPSTFAEGEHVDENGTPCAISTACGALLTGTLSPVNVGVAQSLRQVVDGTTALLDDNGLLAQFDYFGSPVLLEGPYADTGNDGIIAWGRASGATGGEFSSGTPLHYVVGVPSDLSALGGLTGTYTLLGATQLTGLSSGKVGGTLNSMTMTAVFSSGGADVSGAMGFTVESKPILASFTGVTAGARIDASGSTDDPLGSGSISLTGFFAGSNAARAGFVYGLSDSRLSENYVGAAALQQTGLK